jgi:predicted TIM-barrel fold metal-dependent hydrolase
MLPVVAERIVGLAPALNPDHPLPREQVFGNLKRLHYDLAGFPVPTLLTALKDIADPDRIFYGSDWPFTPTAPVEALARQIAETDSLDDAWRAKIYRDNPLRLFPRLSAKP